LNPRANLRHVRRYLRQQGSKKILNNFGDKDSTPLWQAAFISRSHGDPRMDMLRDGGISGSSQLHIDGKGRISHMPFSSPNKVNRRVTFKRK
jgi:hypothetical protein